MSLILDLPASGMRAEEILAEYREFEPEDIRAAIAYGAEMARNHYGELPPETAT